MYLSKIMAFMLYIVNTKLKNNMPANMKNGTAWFIVDQSVAFSHVPSVTSRTCILNMSCLTEEETVNCRLSFFYSVSIMFTANVFQFVKKTFLLLIYCKPLWQVVQFAFKTTDSPSLKTLTSYYSPHSQMTILSPGLSSINNLFCAQA